MTEKELTDLKLKIAELVKNVFNEVDKFYYKGNEKAGIRTRKTLVELSKTFKSLRQNMLQLTSIRKSERKELKAYQK